MNAQNGNYLILLLVLTLAEPGWAREPIPYPQGTLTAEQIVEQAYIVAHGGLVRNAVSRRNKRDVGLVISRAPLEKRGPGRKPILNTFETYMNSSPQDPAIDSLQMALITSGKVKGTGILYTSYTDTSKSGSLSIWLPALRKIRFINEPAHDDTWIGTNLTYGELVLRLPEHEHHELLGENEFEDCLPSMKLEPGEMTRYTKSIPGPQCEHKGKPVYRIKSTTKFENWWYDEHISDVDKKTFALYRTVYFKDGEKIKTVVIDWQSLGQPDLRINYPRYIYALTHTSGTDSMVYVPRSTISLDVDLPDSFWSEETLKKRGQ